jgi:hypothetical protein
MPSEEHQRIRQRFADMSETELIAVARSYGGLRPDAQALLREEFSRRSLEPPLIEEDTELVEEEPELAYQHLVTVATYRDLSEGIVARAALEAADIPCLLKDENMIRMDWGYSNFLGGLRLQVPEQDAAKAHEILSAPRPESIDFAEDPGFEQPTCPKCGSTDIDLQKPRRTNLAWLWFFGIPSPSRSKHPGKEVWHCLTCGCTWLDDEQPSPAHS